MERAPIHLFVDRVWDIHFESHFRRGQHANSLAQADCSDAGRFDLALYPPWPAPKDGSGFLEITPDPLLPLRAVLPC